MQRRTLLAISLLTMLVFSWSAAIAHGSSINYAIHGEKVLVVLSLQFFQNATTMPSVSGTFTGSSAQDLTAALEEGLKNRASNVSVSSLSGELRSDNGWINSTIRFEIAGASSRKGDLLSVNCSWVPFSVSRDLKFGNLSYNLIGATYVRSEFEKYVDYDKAPLNETIANALYLSEKAALPPRSAASRAGEAVLLDFRNLVPPIEKWDRSYDVAKSATTWTYNFAPAFDLTMTVTPRQGIPFSVHAFYRYNATVSVDGLAQAQQSIIITDVSTGFEPFLMLAATLVAFIAAVMISWRYRSRRRQMLRRRK